MKKLLLNTFLAVMMLGGISGAQVITGGSTGTSGASFPLTSPTANPAASGQLRLADNTDKICWRNAANSADICFYVDASNVFQMPGTLNIGSLTTGGTGADTYTALADPACSTSFLLWASTTTANTFKYCDGNSNIRILANQSGTSGGIPYYSSATTEASSAALTLNVLPKGGGAGGAPSNSLITDNGTTAAYTGTGGYVAPTFVSNGSGAGYFQYGQGSAQGHAAATTITEEAPASVTSYEIVKPGAAASGIPTWTNAANVVTESVTATSGSGSVCLATSCAMTTPKATTIQDANAAPFIQSSATASAVDGITVTTAATANPATVTIAGSGSDTNINTAISAKGSGTVNASTFFQATSNRVAMTADWTCGTSSVSTSCTAATIVGTNGTPLTLTLPLQAQSWHLHCEGVVGQATAATSNQWNLLTATNGATNVTATYKMATAATASAYGAVTDQAATTTTFQIAPNWTLGGTATKMPFSIDASIEGASASGTVVSLQLLAPTAADVVTIYRGAFCSVSSF